MKKKQQRNEPTYLATTMFLFIQIKILNLNRLENFIILKILLVTKTLATTIT